MSIENQTGRFRASASLIPSASTRLACSMVSIPARIAAQLLEPLLDRLPRHPGAPRPHHPGLGCGGHQRGVRGEDRAVSVHADGFVAESLSMSRSFFFGFFYFPSQLAEGAG